MSHNRHSLDDALVGASSLWRSRHTLCHLNHKKVLRNEGKLPFQKFEESHSGQKKKNLSKHFQIAHLSPITTWSIFKKH